MCLILTNAIIEKGRRDFHILGRELFSELNPEVEPEAESEAEPEVESEADTKDIDQLNPAHTMRPQYRGVLIQLTG